MDAMLNNEAPLWAGALEAVQEAKAQNAVVLDLTGQCSWTDYMVIVTATSRMHLRGISQKVLEVLKEDDRLYPRNSKHSKDEDQWILMDCGSLVVQIMTSEAREYYDLESVWFQADVVYRENEAEETQSSSSSSS